jgi:hypothetical protein
MDPAHQRVTAPDDPALLEQVAAQLARQSDPPISVRRELVLAFECETADFMLRARVADALMAVCGHGEWRRLFVPLD